MRSQIASPKTGESNRGQRITAPREKLQGPGGQAHWKGADQGLDVGMDELIQGIILTQASNPGLPHCRQTLYHLSHQGEEAGKAEEE